MKNQKILDGLKVICICKGIKKRVFLKKISEGVKTLAGLKKATGAGTGPCEGRRCTPKIIELLQGI